MRHAIAKVTAAGNQRVLVTERGVSFGYNNLVVDVRAFPMLRELGYPVVFDVTHSLQLPGAGDGVTSGLAQYIEPLASAGVAAGVDAIFMEVHEDPARAKSDAANALRLDYLEPLIRKLQRIDAASRERAIPDAAAVVGSPRMNKHAWRRTSHWRARSCRQRLPPSSRLSTASTNASSARFACCSSATAASSSPAWASPASSAGRSRPRFSSTGTPAFFLHPAEAIHGDLGVLQSDDVIVALSHSGETEELLRLLETIKRLGARLIAITGEPQSTLAQAADVALDCHVSKEACPLNLVPTASTTAALALGDALAMTLLVTKGFRQEDFANLHPGGKLGKRLMRAGQLMHAGDQAPIVGATAEMREVIYEISRKKLGMSCVTDEAGRLVGHHHRRRFAATHGRHAEHARATGR